MKMHFLFVAIGVAMLTFAASEPAAGPTPASTEALKVLPIAVPRMLTWRVTPQPDVLMTSPRMLLFPPDPADGAFRFLASEGECALLVWSDDETDKTAPAAAAGGRPRGSFALFIDADEGPESAFTVDPDHLFVRQNGRVIGWLTDSEGGLSDAAFRTRLAALTGEDLKAFRSLPLDAAEAGDASDRQAETAALHAFLRRLAEARPQRLALMVGDAPPAEAFAGLEPIAVFAPEAVAGWVARVSGKRMRHVVAEKADAALCAASAAWPEMRTFYISSPDSKEAPVPEFPAVAGLSLPMVPFAKGAFDKHKNLARLLAPVEAIAGIDLGATFPKLLSLATTVSPLPSVPSRLQHLCFIGDKGVTPELLERVVAANPELRIIEFSDCNALPDLSAFKRLPRLEALLFQETETADMKTLAELTNVRYFALPAKAFEDGGSAELKELRSRRPEAKIVPVTTLCLGSGWILLLLPVLAAAVVASRRARRRHAPCGTAAP